MHLVVAIKFHNNTVDILSRVFDEVGYEILLVGVDIDT